MGRVEEAREIDTFIKEATLAGWHCGWTEGIHSLGVHLSRDKTWAGERYWLFFDDRKGWVFQKYVPRAQFPPRVKTTFAKGMKRLRKAIKDSKC